MSVVTVHMVYICASSLSEIILQNVREYRGVSWAVSFICQWVNDLCFYFIYGKLFNDLKVKERSLK